MSTPTQITINPARDTSELSAFPNSNKRLAGERLAFGESKDSNYKMFGEEGFGFKAVLDTINPLQHIPGVSAIYEEATGDVASTGAKLIGGALIGGPIGFVASLADVIFKEATGHTVGGAVVAALSGGEEETIQTASAEATQEPANVQKVAEASMEILPPAPQAQVVTPEVAPMKMASAIAPGASTADQELLSLFGDADTRSAHNSYRKAQFKPYLNDVTHSMML